MCGQFTYTETFNDAEEEARASHARLLLGKSFRGPPCYQALGTPQFQGVPNDNIFEVCSVFKSTHVQTLARPWAKPPEMPLAAAAASR